MDERLIVRVPYKLDPAWAERMLWFVDCGMGSRVSFTSTWDAARWITANARLRSKTEAIHIPSGIGALLPAYVTQRKTVKTKRDMETREVLSRKVSQEDDRKAVEAALKFIIPPLAVEYL